MRAMERLLMLTSPPTAVFCYNDMTALGALRMIRMRGLRVPEDISLVGFDDLFIASYTEPPLTTIRQPKRQMGRRAMELLLQLLRGENSQQTIWMQGELIIRHSTAPPR
jgi:DNA-binding LacI/PurR family transcriptional regulator